MDVADGVPPLVAHAVEKTLRIPDSHRDFTVPAADAARVHRFDSGLMEQLLDLGLAHRGSGAERRFDQLDLENIGIDLRLPCPRWTAMRWWSNALPSRVEPSAMDWTLTLKVACPTRESAHECDLRYHPAAVSAGEPEFALPDSAGEFRIELTTRWTDHRFGEAFTGLFASILPFEFHLMPQVLGHDARFAADTGLADCRQASILLAETASRTGITARRVSGLFLARPFAIWHYWIEVLDGGRWIAADPFLLNAFIRWDVVDAGAWPVDRSPSGVLWRLPEPRGPFATHGGAALKAVRALSAPRPRPGA
ncbi:transglutaminase domain-containing protein [Actinospica durhamensis]|uniref:Transglutaminase domain-containing protein n=1 Tax=Actinospica durhamensis TaxID=1508375 RepID=A0A941EJR3_9ACTN|nr:transglutaminase domain-containing protein [Actinospica durhamensis]MBR7831787.1 transglutaminase domain-containing protein [Actinospica durhamensis]